MNHPADGSSATVDIICSVLNGAPYLAPLIRSIQGQTHRAWRLWVRDDGSTDDTLATLDAFAAADPRVSVLHRGGPALGCASAFGWVMERVPAESRYLMIADADDVWLPEKIAVTLDAMQRAEAAHPGPVLVHTDLQVVDAELRELHASLWGMAGLDPARVTLRELIQRNVVTAPSVMVNAALRGRIGATPEGLVAQDWWYACVAAITGRIVAVPQATVQYRQHAGNIGGAAAAPTAELATLLPAARRATGNTARFRRDVTAMARQAVALLDRFGDEIAAADRAAVEEVARIAQYRGVQRKLAVARLRATGPFPMLRALAAAWRA